MISRLRYFYGEFFVFFFEREDFCFGVFFEGDEVGGQGLDFKGAFIFDFVVEELELIDLIF